MNSYIYCSRVIRYWASWVQDRFISIGSRDTVGGAISRYIVYSILYPVSRYFRHIGRKEYLYTTNSSSAGRELDHFMFRKLTLYVEGYLANIAYRFTDAPKVMPPDWEIRSKWGREALKQMASPDEGEEEYEIERRKNWEEIARIYDWYRYERKNWSDPYIGKVNIDHDDLLSFSYSDENKKLMEMSNRYNEIFRERKMGRVERLFERRHMLLYD